MCMKELKFINILQSIAILGLSLGIVCLLLFRKKQPETTPVSLETQVNQTPEEFESLSELESYHQHETTGEKILLSDSAFGEIWIPVLAEVPACTYQTEKFVTRNNLTYYLEDKKIVSKLGIDVSAHQGDINWQEVKSAGIDFVMIRAGYRGYTEGTLVKDEYFEKNMQGAQEAGLDIGVYFYSQAINTEEAIEEAEMVLNLINGANLTYPVVYDWEVVTTDTARTDTISVETLTNCSIAFCEKIKESGYIPMIYQNKRTSLLKLDLPELTDYDFWLAEYNRQATYYYHYQMWQYASDGRIAGISGEVD
ncbi:MAG: glycoside hydrolase family 25 protein, partial [Oscillospiraceae bacterium]|nr:glycoside hydrolase family 25 protein [Oscillospiraceae bacterium]